MEESTLNMRSITLSFFLTLCCCQLNAQTQTGIFNIDDIRVSAERGDAEAQFKLGQHYCSSTSGSDKNYVTAMKWMVKASNQGNLGATRMIGDFYELGWGVKKDMGTAIKYWRQAADKGDAQAQTQIGIMYLTGKKGSPNKTEAMKWLTLALKQRHYTAAINLSYWNENGLYGFKNDKVEAVKYMAIAIEFGMKGDQMNEKFEALKKSLTEEQRDEAKTRTKDFLATIPDQKTPTNAKQLPK